MTPPVQRPATSSLSMYASIVGIGAFCALIIVSVVQATAARIEDNRERALKAAIAEVLPTAASTVSVAIDEDGAVVATESESTLPVFLGYDVDGELIGAAITGEGMGYADTIRVLFAYSFAEEAITAMTILDSKETPGLGDRVEVEPHFLASLERLDARVAADGSGLANAIVTVKQGEKTEAWQIDGITGATITSVAIGDILNGSAAVWAPALQANAERLATMVPTPEETN